MRAIIIPLNKFFFNYEKYDGTIVAERFWRRNQRLKKIIFGIDDTKIGNWIINYLIISPLILPFVIVYFGPLFIKHFLKEGRKNINEHMHHEVDLFEEKLDRTKWMQKMDIFPFIRKYQLRQFAFFVYYTSDMIPKKEKRRKEFFEKLQLMKDKLNIVHVSEANTKADIENILTLYKVDANESFFMTDGNIDLSNYPMVETTV